MPEDKVDFFFVGFPKSGSTTYYHLLKSHPEIFSPDVKEINYFNSDHNLERKKLLGQNYFQLASSDDDYAKFFQDAKDKIKGDFNPIYIFSEEAPRNLFNYNPAARILVSIREPVSFLRSFHFQSLYNLIENEPNFLKALSLEESRRSGHNIPEYCYNPFYLYYSALVEYNKYIKHYVDVFGCNNVKIVLFDDIMEDEYRVYKEILNFLHVKNVDFIPPKPDRNPSHVLRFSWLRKFLFSPPINRWLYTNIPQQLLPLGAKISQKIFKKTQEKPYVSRTEEEQLKIQFRPKVAELDAFLNTTGLLNRDLLTIWGY
jgi:Sulfotransferase domain